MQILYNSKLVEDSSNKAMTQTHQQYQLVINFQVLCGHNLHSLITLTSNKCILTWRDNKGLTLCKALNRITLWDKVWLHHSMRMTSTPWDRPLTTRVTWWPRLDKSNKQWVSRISQCHPLNQALEILMTWIRTTQIQLHHKFT